ncbi:hypothetical protein HPB48_001334 [Haemaphysalis longicornis]|uniref:Uncharacterized protein n=1 Tax=Haemaphysalis longicornis TaxID=44386 RepID=A0A9J6GP83_HAELO|nr:hypothetical protein HPB48_001334 [Haemaphysalis longicornis]
MAGNTPATTTTAGNVPNLLAKTHHIEPARAPAPGPQLPVVVHQATNQSSQPTKRILKNPARRDPEVAVHAVSTHSYSSLWDDLWLDEGCRMAACSVVTCALFTIAVVVSAFFFYTTSSGEDGISEPAAEAVAATNNSTTATRDTKSGKARQKKLINETSFSAPQEQDDSIMGDIENGDVAVTRQYLENEDEMQEALATSLEKAAIEWFQRNATPPRRALVNKDSTPFILPESSDNTVPKREILIRQLPTPSIYVRIGKRYTRT